MNLVNVEILNGDKKSKINTSAIVANDYFFSTGKGCDVVKIVVDTKTSGKFKKTNISTQTPSGPLNYCNLQIENVEVFKKKIMPADKYGKLKFSLTLPDDCVEGLAKLQKSLYQQVARQLKKAGLEIDDMRRLIYTNQEGTSNWIYVDVDLNDKYMVPSYENGELTVEEFANQASQNMYADIVLKVSPTVWQKDDGGIYDFSLKLKLIHANFHGANE